MLCVPAFQSNVRGVAQDLPLRAPVPVDPIGAILDAFASHAIVALGERAHTGAEDQAFRLSLIRDPRFATVVNDVVLERGNARYQELVDRYMRGADVPPAELRRVWQNSTATTEELDTPISEELFRALRDINRSLPPSRQLRVVLAEPPIDWDSVSTLADVLKYGDVREEHAAGVIQREVLAKKRRALLIFGRKHVLRRNDRSNFETDNFLAGLLERDGQTRLFTVWSFAGKEDLDRLPSEVGQWRAPGFVRPRGTTLGALDVTTLLPDDPRMAIRDGRFQPLPREAWRSRRVDEEFDALLYLGPVVTSVSIARELCDDAAYIEMRTRRMALTPRGQADIARLKKQCGK